MPWVTNIGSLGDDLGDNLVDGFSGGLNGSVTETPTVSTTYSVTAYKDGWPISVQLPVTVVTPGPILNLFGGGICDGGVFANWYEAVYASSYIISRRVSEQGSYSQIQTPSIPYFSDTPPLANIAYDYQIQATDTYGNVGPASVITLVGSTVPAVPTGLSAAPGNSLVSLTWNASANTTQYQVYRNSTLYAILISSSFIDYYALNGTAYSYTVAAINNCGASSQSSAASATPLLSYQTWSSVSAPSDTWTPETPVADTWTTVSPGSTTWTPES